MEHLRKLAAVSAVGLALSVAGYGVASAVAQHAVTVRLGTPRALPAGFFGTNYDYGGAPDYVQDTQVPGGLAALAPGRSAGLEALARTIFSGGKGIRSLRAAGLVRRTNARWTVSVSRSPTLPSRTVATDVKALHRAFPGVIVARSASRPAPRSRLAPTSSRSPASPSS